MSVSEDEIVIGCKKNDPKSQTALYHQFSSRLFGLCLRYAHTRVEAEDILQDAFMRIYNKIHLHKENAPFYPWAKRLTINVALRFLEKKNALKYSADVDDFHKEYATKERITGSLLKEELMNMINQLPEGKKTIFNLYVVDGYSHKEIADMLQISEGTSKSQLFKAKEMLRDLHIAMNKQYEGQAT